MPQVRHARCSLPYVCPGITQPHQSVPSQQNLNDDCIDTHTQMNSPMLWFIAVMKSLKATALNSALHSCLLWIVLINQQQA